MDEKITQRHSCYIDKQSIGPWFLHDLVLSSPIIVFYPILVVTWLTWDIWSIHDGTLLFDHINSVTWVKRSCYLIHFILVRLVIRIFPLEVIQLLLFHTMIDIMRKLEKWVVLVFWSSKRVIKFSSLCVRLVAPPPLI